MRKPDLIAAHVAETSNAVAPAKPAQSSAAFEPLFSDAEMSAVVAGLFAAFVMLLAAAIGWA